jgi:hypothetical protein
MLLWGLALVGLGVSLLALAAWRRHARRLDSLAQSYWELRYEQSRLRSEVARLSPGSSQAAEDEVPQPAPSVAYVPLASLKPGLRKSD